MSWYTTIIIPIAPCEMGDDDAGAARERVQEIRAYFVENGFRPPLFLPELLPKRSDGGWDSFAPWIVTGAFNHLNVCDLKDHLRTQVRWQYPEDVEMLVQDESDFKYRVERVFPPPAAAEEA